MSGPHQPPSQVVGNPMGQSLPATPVQAVVPIPDTSSQAGVSLEEEADKSLETSTSSLRRVVEKTVDKFGRTRSLNSKSPSKRIFSLGRNRGKEPSPLGATLIPSRPLRVVLTSRRLQRTRRHQRRLGAATPPMILLSLTLPPLPLQFVRL